MKNRRAGDSPDDRSVTIDAFPESAFRHLGRSAIVCIDIISTTTTLVTSVAQGRHTVVASGLDRAYALAERLEAPVLAGEVSGKPPSGFSLADSPTHVEAHPDPTRPMVLLSDPGTRLISNTRGCPAVYVASYRNMNATAQHVTAHHTSVALLGAGANGVFACEDQMAAAWMAAALVEAGFAIDDMRTSEMIERWNGVDVSLTAWGNSAAALRKGAHSGDLEYIISHVDDLDLVCSYRSEVVAPWSESSGGRILSWPESSKNLGASI